jgi:hypothetical protein
VLESTAIGGQAGTSSRILVKEIEATPRVRVRLQAEVAPARGDHRLTELVLRDRITGRDETVPAAALFVMIGATPHTGWLPDDVAPRSGRNSCVPGRAGPSGHGLSRHQALRKESTTAANCVPFWNRNACAASV